MNLPQSKVTGLAPAASLRDRFRHIRQATLDLCTHLAPEDMVVQSMPDVSPAKWHLAHTTWFFEQFVLGRFANNYQPFNADWYFLFNSYYYSAGKMFRRPDRGLLSRPTVDEIREYRDVVDTHMDALLDTTETDSHLAYLIELGLNHEQQHQELLLTDIKHVLAQNPLKPAMQTELPPALRLAPETAAATEFLEFQGGTTAIGASQDTFCFDNETPRHTVQLEPFQLASRTVSNGEYLEFIADGGYSTPALWLSDGWAAVLDHGWNRPMYWNPDLDAEFSLYGELALDPNRPVCHLSFYEADAFARWAASRLPTEYEWEHVAASLAVAGNLQDNGVLHPTGATDSSGMSALYGDVWEWTATPYTAYPRFNPLAGSLGEYNSKFMCNQIVLRGGSCVTPADHIRATYRNFFYPDARWQFSGIRLAKDV